MSVDAGDATEARKPSPSPTADSCHEDSNVAVAQAAEQSAIDGDGSGHVGTDAPLPDEEVPPLPDEEAPPLPDEPPPNDEDDGWEPKWDYNAGAYYFFNNKTGVSQWENPRIPTVPAFHGSYDRFANYYRLRVSFTA